MLDHATSEIASGSKLGIDATKKLPGEGFKRLWPPLIKMDAAVKATAQILHRPQARAPQIADRLVGLVRHVDEEQFARAVEPGQGECVAPVRLDPVAALFGHQRRRDESHTIFWRRRWRASQNPVSPATWT